MFGLENTFVKRAPKMAKLHGFAGFTNDHIAFRCLGMEPFDIDTLETTFLQMGYYPQQDYEFKEKNLTARSYILPINVENRTRRIFLSQQNLNVLSDDLLDIVNSLCRKITPTQAAAPSIFFNPCPWRRPILRSEYELAKEENEYVSWVLMNGATPNHFTLSLPQSVKSVEPILNHVESMNFEINEFGGRIKGLGTDLEQGSTMAEYIQHIFPDDPHIIYAIPTYFYEFAKRRNGFDGFMVENANKIFESTNIDPYKKK